MAGAYCQYCDHRCFVDRQVFKDGKRVWSGHMATCTKGAEHDRKSLGVDFRDAYNPHSKVYDFRAPYGLLHARLTVTGSSIDLNHTSIGIPDHDHFTFTPNDLIDLSTNIEDKLTNSIKENVSLGLAELPPAIPFTVGPDYSDLVLRRPGHSRVVRPSDGRIMDPVFGRYALISAIISGTYEDEPLLPENTYWPSDYDDE